MEYDFRKIEEDCRKKWKDDEVYKVSNPEPGKEFDKPKYYVLDMFPYPSGAGLHVGHPLGYIASDIYSRYKRLKGFNVLHPMGFDSFGLPAEQYAIETGQHPATTTEKNIETFKAQLDKIGFCYDWGREIRTSDPSYYKWTQWIFLQLFKNYFCHTQKKALPISLLVEKYETKGSAHFTAEEWKSFTKKEREDILMKRRLAFSAYGEVNWCEALGTVLANDEVVNGVSERGGHPVVKKKMRQWYLRITEYADRLLEGLETVSFSDAMKEMQRNWIGKSEGAEMIFSLIPSPSPSRHLSGEKGFTETETKMDAENLSQSLGTQSDKENSTDTDLGHPSRPINVMMDEGQGVRVYTTRPDTIFGVDFLVLAPEHELVSKITTDGQKQEIENYLTYVKSRSDRERMAEVKQITGCFTGAYAANPFDGKLIPIWIAEYVLAGYGTGAIMAVPCGDQRDFAFAKHFNIPITNIIGHHYNGQEANATKDAVLQNSGFLNGMLMKDAIAVAINKIEEEGIGKRKVNYRMRDAGFSRQRYWGEPFPIIWSDGIALPLDAEELPLELPFVEKYGPGPEGEGPLANIKEWTLIPSPSPRVEKGVSKNEAEIEAKGAALVPKYKVRSPMQYELAKGMRKEYTEAENLLWQQLRDQKLNVKFRRQHPIECYIADFICLDHALIVEADGGYHESEEQKKYDEERNRILNEVGFTVIRFTNYEILNDTQSVLSKIKEALQISRIRRNNENTKSSEFSHPSPPADEGMGVRETSTMPGYAGSSWYFLRYMDPKNTETFCDRNVSDYWNQVDVYIGGTEHAVGHLLYSRMWAKVLYDLNLIGFDEPFKKLVNQGMIQGSSRFVYRISVLNVGNDKPSPMFVSFNIYKEWLENKLSMRNLLDRIFSVDDVFVTSMNLESAEIMINQIHVDVNIVDGVELNIEAFKKWKNGEFLDAKFILEDGKYICGSETEKMSKSKYNTVNPDDLVNKYGADTFRMYEMFLGPVEQSKPWDTKGIEGVHRFLRKLWRLFYDEHKGAIWTTSAPRNDHYKFPSPLGEVAQRADEGER
ncbi:MAG: DUF559 domain-containing protein, partial [Ferruginibacter sp.]